MASRKYGHDEIREILDLAIRETDSPAPAQNLDGLTLEELQEVGREIGLPPARVADAARSYETRGEVVPRETSMGLPRSVGRIVPLDRAPSDREWEILVGEMRSTFGVKGEVTSQGEMREWSHEALHAFIEPTETGYRLRLTETTAVAEIGMAVGGVFLALAVMIFVVLLGKEDPGFRFVVPAFFSLFGGGLMGSSYLTLPRWADERERAMEQVARRAASLLAGPPHETD